MNEEKNNSIILADVNQASGSDKECDLVGDEISSVASTYDGSRWDLAQRNLDSSISLSQFSLATTNTADASSATYFGLHDSTDRLSVEEELTTLTKSLDDKFSITSQYGTTIVNEKHANYILMYDMLTGIRIAVSSCQAKPTRPLTEVDFSRVERLGFDSEGNETTPSSRFEFKFKDYAPWVFRYIRESSHIDAADYLVSLTGKYALNELGSSGKSGSFFYYSQDLRFIIKTIRRTEHIFLRRILKYYYEHIRTNPNTLITRIFGLHRLRMSSTRKIYFVVMSNIFPPNKELHEVYDLKGSTQGRFISKEKLQSDKLVTQKDLNWVENKRKLILGPAKATLLMNQLKADCHFLAKLNIMDYSLLVGLHSLPKGNSSRKQSMTVLEPSNGHRFRRSEYSSSNMNEIPTEKRFNEFYGEEGGFRSSLVDDSSGDEIFFLGIIDILTPYDSKKKIEHLFKSIQYERDAISAISPPEYSKRFLRFMAENIIQDKSLDYANKSLPEIPEDFTIDESCEEAVVVNN